MRLSQVDDQPEWDIKATADEGGAAFPGLGNVPLPKSHPESLHLAAARILHFLNLVSSRHFMNKEVQLHSDKMRS